MLTLHTDVRQVILNMGKEMRLTLPQVHSPHTGLLTELQSVRCWSGHLPCAIHHYLVVPVTTLHKTKDIDPSANIWSILSPNYKVSYCINSSTANIDIQSQKDQILHLTHLNMNMLQILKPIPTLKL